MAIFHMNAKIISRKAGRSSTAAAAYRSGEKIYDQRTGETHDYERRAGVEYAEVIMPAGSEWAPSRAELWNGVEAKNKRADAQVAREIEVALPALLSPGQRRELAREFAQHIADRYGIAADLCIHAPSRGGDQRNHHAHILTTTNRIEGKGFGNKVRELDMIANARSSGGPNEIEHLREQWAEVQNRYLERAGGLLRVDHRSLEAQGVDRPPTSHKGPKVIQMERRGERTERGEQGRELQKRRAEVVKLAKVKEQIEAERQKTTVPEQVKAIWHNETAKQFDGVKAKAERIEERARVALVRHAPRLEEHRRQRPALPTGLFARFRMATYEQAHVAWDSLRDSLQHRADQLGERIAKLGRYMRRSGSHEDPTPGERLAERKAEAAHPDLAAAYRQVTAQEKQQQEERQKRALGLWPATKTAEQRKQEVLERFRAKRDKERENSRDRGRGR